MPIARWWSPDGSHAHHPVAVCSGFSQTSDKTTHNTTHKDSPAHSEGPAGDTRSRPAATPLISPRGSGVRRLREKFTGRRPATPTTKHRASDERNRTVFHPKQVDEALERNETALARLYRASQLPELDAELRDILLLATSDVRIANQQLCALLEACVLCGEPGLKRVCRNCGARRSAS